jgi:mercuric ion transport protein
MLMPTNSDNHVFETGRGLLAVAGLIGAVAASFGLGVSGAWIGNLARLAPYQPYFIAGTLVCIGGGCWLFYRSSNTACTDGEACARPLPRRLMKIVLVVATALVMTALGFDFIAPLLLDS